MALYDNYFTNEDKPFAENLNDALLLSNVFDMTVDVEAPKMFSNKTWVNTTSPRKCSVSILTLKEGLPSGVSVGTDSETGNSTLTGSGTVSLSWYPNFNSFGKFKAITWEADGSITVNLKTINGTLIASNISKGTIENQSAELRTLQEIVIEIVLTNATLKSLTVTMENKQQERYGATVGISDVTNLQDNLNAKVNVADVIDNLTTFSSIKPLSANQGAIMKLALDNKSGVTHNHDDRYVQKYELKNSWTKWNTVNPYITAYYNDKMGIVDFRYYRQNYNFTTTDEITVENIDMGWCTPKMATPLTSYNSTIIGAVLVGGNLTVQTTSTGTKTINLRGMWHYEL